MLAYASAASASQPAHAARTSLLSRTNGSALATGSVQVVPQRGSNKVAFVVYARLKFRYCVSHAPRNPASDKQKDTKRVREAIARRHDLHIASNVHSNQRKVPYRLHRLSQGSTQVRGLDVRRTR